MNIIKHKILLSFACAIFLSFNARAFESFLISMDCLNPIGMYRLRKGDSGKILYTARMPDSRLATRSDPDVFVPCGKCLACKENRRREWSKRLQSEMWTNPLCSFITLTYNDENLPSELPPSKDDIQKFIKKFRHLERDFKIPLDNFKYFIVVELGSRTRRPHYHGVLFGVDCLSDAFRPKLATVKDGHLIYSSQVLESIWKKGFVTVDHVNPSVINYVTKYVLKTLEDENLWFVYSRNIGVDWFFRNGKLTSNGLTAFDNGYCVFGNIDSLYRTSIPKSFLKRLEAVDPARYDHIKERNRNFVLSKAFDSRYLAERVVGFKQRLKNENEKRTLDNEQNTMRNS